MRFLSLAAAIALCTMPLWAQTSDRASLEGAYKPYVATFHISEARALYGGVHIHYEGDVRCARDSQGRIYREDISPLHVNQLSYTISDPVVGLTYAWQGADGDITITEYHADPPGTAQALPVQAAMKRYGSMGQTYQNLGLKEIFGLSEQGERRESVVPAGLIGNAAPLKNSFESWVIPALGNLWGSYTAEGPMSGRFELVLKDLKLAEPDPGLFLPPAGQPATVVLAKPGSER